MPAGLGLRRETGTKHKMRLEEPNVLERLFEHGGEVYGHILQVLCLSVARGHFTVHRCC